jgi:hypothetical protein
MYRGCLAEDEEVQELEEGSPGWITQPWELLEPELVPLTLVRGLAEALLLKE